jgi:hypothetical protein
MHLHKDDLRLLTVFSEEFGKAKVTVGLLLVYGHVVFRDAP